MLTILLIATLVAAFGVEVFHSHSLAQLPLHPADAAARRTRLLLEAWALSGIVLVAFATAQPTLR